MIGEFNYSYLPRTRVDENSFKTCSGIWYYDPGLDNMKLTIDSFLRNRIKNYSILKTDTINEKVKEPNYKIKLYFPDVEDADYYLILISEIFNN